MSTTLIKQQLAKLNIKNNIIETLISLLESEYNSNEDLYVNVLYEEEMLNLMDEIFDKATRMFTTFNKNKDEIIKILNYYLKISNPTQGCYLLINNIIDNLNYRLMVDTFEFSVNDINNSYIILLYYLNRII